MISSWLLQYLPEPVRRHISGRSYLLRVIDNIGWIFSERILRHTVGFAIGIWIARYVGPEEYGLLNYATAFVLVFAFLGALGLDSLAVRDMLRNPASRDETLGTLLALRLTGGLVMMLVTAGAMMLVAPQDPRAPTLILVISVAHLLLATDSIDCWFQANVASRYTVIARLASFFALSLVRIVLIVVQAPLVAFAVANLAESALLAVCMLVVYHRSGQKLARLKVCLARAKTFCAEGWPLFVSALVVSITQRVDQVLLGDMAGYKEVGAYAIAVRVIEATYILPAVIGTSVFPALVKSRDQDLRLYQLQVEKLCGTLLWLAFALSLPLSLFSSVLVRVLVGVEYEHAALPLAILAWMPMFVFFGLVRQRWLIAEDALAAALCLEIAACVINMVMNLLLIPRYGAAGAAMASLIAAAGASLVVAPFSGAVRQSLLMLVRGVRAPFRALRGS